MSKIPVQPQPDQDTQPSPPQKQQNKQAASSKSKGKGMLVLVVAIIAAAAVVTVWVVVHNNENRKPASQPIVAVVPARVNITSGGFTPATINVVVGTTVTWTNADEVPHRVASDPYPTNDGLAGFDSGEALPANGTYSFKFEKTGTFPYHDQQNPYSNKGTVIVTASQN